MASSTAIVFLLTAALLIVGSLSLDEKGWETVTSCRATCLEKLLPSDSVTTEDCEQDSDCYMCWTMCERLLEDTQSWAPMCKDLDAFICPDGCDIACVFMSSSLDDMTSDVVGFPADPQMKIVSESMIELTWETPESGHKLVLFSLFWRDANNPDWLQFATTSESFHNAEVNFKLFVNLQFLVKALTSKGLLAEATITSEHSSDYPDYFEYHDYQEYDTNPDMLDGGMMNFDVSMKETVTSEEAEFSGYDATAEVEQVSPALPAVTCSPALQTLFSSFRTSYYVALACCGLLTVVALTLTGLLLWNQTQFREVVTTRAALLRDRGSSLRRSISRSSRRSHSIRGKSPSKVHVFLDEEAAIGATHC